MKDEALTKGLEQLRLLAAKKNGCVTVGEILAAFPALEMDRERVAAIYDYLAGEGIAVEDYVPHDTESMTFGEAAERSLLGDGEDFMDEEEKKVYEMYLDELAEVPLLGAKEEELLLQQLLSGSEGEKEAARSRLTEGNLRWVLQLARSFAGCGVPLNDLIQEGNMALMLQLDSLETAENAASALEKGICEAMRGLIREQNGYDRAGERMAADANRILELTKQIEEEENRAVTAEELSAALHMPKTRVEEVLRESAHAIMNAEKK